MKEFLRAKIFALLGLVIVILAGKLLMDVFNPQYIFAGEDVFAYYLETAMNLAIGVELIKMLCMHSPGTVIEVLLFAIARQVVVSHSSVTQTLTGVFAIVVLFATR